MSDESAEPGPVKPKRKHKGLKITGGVFLVLMGISAVAHTNTSATLKPRVATHHSTKTVSKTPTKATHHSTKTVSKTPTKQEPSTTIAPAKTTKAAQPVVLQTESGNGQGSEPQFTVPSSASGWTLTTTYNCSSNGAAGNFAVDITGYGSAQGTSDIGPNALGMGATATDSYYDTGTFQLAIISECAWTYKVATIPG
jgi:cytoskeletal protein RodZ